MKAGTRRGGWLGMLAFAVVLSNACGQGASEGGSTSGEPPAGTAEPAPAEAATAPPAEGPGVGAGNWDATVAAHAPRGFRPAAWQDERTIVGLARSRIVRVRADTALVLPGPPGMAWSVDTAPGVLSWTNEAGWWVQPAGGEPDLRVPMAAAPAGTDGPPDALWSPDGTRALLSWTGEGANANALATAHGRTLDLLTIRLSGFLPLHPALWLDHERILLSARALTRHDGTGGATEAGQRGELAVYAVERGTVRIVVPAPDDRFLLPAGMVAGDTVLVIETDRQGARVAAWAYHTRRWTRTARPLPAGRAFPHPSGRVAVITPEADGGRLVVAEGARIHSIAGVHPVDAAPLAWSPDGRRLAVVDALPPGRLVLVHPAAESAGGAARQAHTRGPPR